MWFLRFVNSLYRITQSDARLCCLVLGFVVSVLTAFVCNLNTRVATLMTRLEEVSVMFKTFY